MLLSAALCRSRFIWRPFLGSLFTVLMGLAARKAADDLALETDRGHGNRGSLAGAPFSETHLGEEESQVALLKLKGALASQVFVEVLSRASDREKTSSSARRTKSRPACCRTPFT